MLVEADAETISATCVGAVTYQTFSNCRNLTKENMAKSLSDVLRIVERQQQYILYLERQSQRLKSDVITHQGSVVDLQKELLAAKDQQLNDMKASVVTSVEDTVKAELQSYSQIVQKSCSSESGPLLDPKVLKTVVKDVFAEEDRSRNLMIFGLAEEKDEKIHDVVSNVLFELGEKPKVEATRIGLASNKGRKQQHRAVKVSVSSSTVVQQVLSKARKLRESEHYSKVFIAPDRSPEQRARHKELVLELKKKTTETSDMRHFIKGGEVHSVKKTANN